MEWITALGVIAAIAFGLSQWVHARRSPERQARGQLTTRYSFTDDVHRLVISTPGDKPIEFEGIESIEDFIQLYVNGERVKITRGPHDATITQRPFSVAPGRPAVLDWFDVPAQPTVIAVGLRKINGDVVDVEVPRESAG